MEELSTKEFNEIYKKYFKEYFDKPLKKDAQAARILERNFHYIL